MGREIRRVAPDWAHPRYDEQTGRSHQIGHYIPLYDDDYESKAREWVRDCQLWLEGKHPYQSEGRGKGYKYFWEYDYPPDEGAYRDRAWTPEEATAYQVYETVSEGTPTSPVFQTEGELRQWLSEQGHSQISIDKFLEWGSVPSMFSVVTDGQVQLESNIDAAGLMAQTSSK